MKIARLAPAPKQNFDGPIHWKAVESGLWVGNRGREFAGMIESTRSGDFAAMTCLGHQLGTFASVDAAKQSFAA